MTVTVSGGDLAEAIIVPLGTGATLPAGVTVTGYADNKYVVTLTGLLTEYTAYNVKVEGAGYRNAYYTVNMQENNKIHHRNSAIVTPS